jgi:hypothetical protein
MSAPPGFDWPAELARKLALQTATFGIDVSYQPQGGTAFTVKAIAESVAQPENQSPGVYARLFVNAADFAATPASGDEVTIGSTVYKVWLVEAGIEGNLNLMLRQK